jgi:hypothetical protein
MLGRSPAAQVGTAFGNQPQCQVRTDAVDLRQINARQLVQDRADGGLGSDHFPKRGHAQRHRSWVRSVPWARFFDGDQKPDRRAFARGKLKSAQRRSLIIPSCWQQAELF